MMQNKFELIDARKLIEGETSFTESILKDMEYYFPKYFNLWVLKEGIKNAFDNNLIDKVHTYKVSYGNVKISLSFIEKELKFKMPPYIITDRNIILPANFSSGKEKFDKTLSPLVDKMLLAGIYHKFLLDKNSVVTLPANIEQKTKEAFIGLGEKLFEELKQSSPEMAKIVENQFGAFVPFSVDLQGVFYIHESVDSDYYEIPPVRIYPRIVPYPFNFKEKVIKSKEDAEQFFENDFKNFIKNAVHRLKTANMDDAKHFNLEKIDTELKPLDIGSLFFATNHGLLYNGQDIALGLEQLLSQQQAQNQNLNPSL
jgi:hypothetical protein